MSCDNTATFTFFEMHGRRPVVYGLLPRYFRSKPRNPSRDIRNLMEFGARGGGRTHTSRKGQGILSPPRMPFRHPGSAGVNLYYQKSYCNIGALGRSRGSPSSLPLEAKATQDVPDKNRRPHRPNIARWRLSSENGFLTDSCEEFEIRRHADIAGSCHDRGTRLPDERVEEFQKGFRG